MSVIEDMIQAYDQVFLVEKKCSYEAIITDNIFSERLKLCNTENEKRKWQHQKKHCGTQNTC